jgi:hypothetical protein
VIFDSTVAQQLKAYGVIILKIVHNATKHFFLLHESPQEAKAFSAKSEPKMEIA